MEHTLEVYYKEKIVFYSDANWLYPLFELEEFLNHSGHNPSLLQVKDKIVGRAAAFIMIQLKIGHIEAGLMSQLAKEILDANQVSYHYHQLVDNIQCMTEEFLKEEKDPRKAYLFIKSRIQRATPADR